MRRYGHVKKSRLENTSGLSTSVIALSAAVAAATSSLPTIAAEKQAEKNVLEEISITASRIQRSGFSAPTPTTVFNRDFLDARAETSLGDVLNESPQFFASRSPAANTLNANIVGANFMDLRGFGPNRTLVLLDGRRVVPTTDGNLVDLNLFPSALVERVEVVTGGASAAWGSDAVTGVVNVILKSDMDGFEGSIQTGQSEVGDAEEYKASLGWGGSFANDRARIMVGAELFETKGVVDQKSRSWARDEWQLVQNPNFGMEGEPQFITASNVKILPSTRGGFITSGPLAGTQFGEGGVPMSRELGTPSGLFMIGGDGVNLGADTSTYQPVEQHAAFSRFEYDITQNVTGFVEGSWGKSGSENAILEPWNFGSLVITADNAYLPDSIRQTMMDQGIPSFTMGRLYTDLGAMATDTWAETYRIAGGVRGKIGDNWSWDAYYEYGKTKNNTDLFNNPNVARWSLAQDSVIDPNNGQVVCRSTLIDPSNGCVPLNVFGPNAATDAARDYILGTASRAVRFEQHVAALSVQGEAFDNWAGAVSVAAGIEYREEDIVATADELSLENAFLIGNYKGLTGSRDVKEVFVETIVPLLADKPFAKGIDLNLAGRVTDYSLSGTATTWKAGLNYQLNDELRFRGTVSRDIRAPNMNELFSPGGMLFATVFDPFNQESVTIRRFTQGNVDLDPEEADTHTLGVVYEPRWLEGFQASFDYYDIDLGGAIAQLGIQSTINRCFEGATDLCQFLTRDESGSLVSLLQTNYNLASQKTSGFDLELGYTVQMSDLIGGAGNGSISFRLVTTYVDELIFDDGNVVEDRVGSLSQEIGGGLPQWRGTASVTYSNGPLTYFLQGRYIGGGKYDSTFDETDIDDNDVPSVVYLDTTLAYDILQNDDGESRLQVFATVNNLLDEDPPLVPTSFFVPRATNGILYDVIGRRFTAGIRFNF